MNGREVVAAVVVLAAALFQVQIAAAQETTPSSAKAAETDKPAIQTGYGGKGFWLGTSDGNFLVHGEFRFQFRCAYPFDSDPVTFQEFSAGDESVFKINRARFKVGGHGYRPWLKWYMEYELMVGVMLDFRFMIEKLPALKLKTGQWKVHYNRERIISSGKLQQVERSIITPPFTVDRQTGLGLFGRLAGGGAADFSYWAGIFTGTGRGSTENDDTNMMYSARVQWNMFGRVLNFSGSDIEYHEKPAALIALAANTNRSPYTNFSTAGGGELPGFEPGEPGQYRVYQWMAETALKYRGFSWEQEYHWKEIDDRVNGTITTLRGVYVDAGYFFHHAWTVIPKPLELSLRYAVYDPRVGQESDVQRQYAIDLNWFFNGHRNKLTFDLSRITLKDPVLGEAGGTHVRLQWDISV